MLWHTRHKERENFLMWNIFFSPSFTILKCIGILLNVYTYKMGKCLYIAFISKLYVCGTIFLDASQKKKGKVWNFFLSSFLSLVKDESFLRGASNLLHCALNSIHFSSCIHLHSAQVCVYFYRKDVYVLVQSTNASCLSSWHGFCFHNKKTRVGNVWGIKTFLSFFLCLRRV